MSSRAVRCTKNPGVDAQQESLLRLISKANDTVRIANNLFDDLCNNPNKFTQLEYDNFHKNLQNNFDCLDKVTDSLRSMRRAPPSKLFQETSEQKLPIQPTKQPIRPGFVQSPIQPTKQPIRPGFVQGLQPLISPEEEAIPAFIHRPQQFILPKIEEKKPCANLTSAGIDSQGRSRWKDPGTQITWCECTDSTTQQEQKYSSSLPRSSRSRYHHIDSPRRNSHHRHHSNSNRHKHGHRHRLSSDSEQYLDEDY